MGDLLWAYQDFALVAKCLVSPAAHGADGFDRADAIVRDENLADGSGSAELFHILLQTAEVVVSGVLPLRDLVEESEETEI